ncbi:MAG: hypothetical protein ABI321_06370 [Polyangia bacterium]
MKLTALGKRGPDDRVPMFRGTQSTVVTDEVSVHFDRLLSAEERAMRNFTPFHDAGGIRPVGVINALRKSYVGSQSSRGVE